MNTNIVFVLSASFVRIRILVSFIMSQHKLLRLNELIKVELGLILLKELDIEEGVLVTITRVKTAQDLLSALVFISVYPEKKRMVVVKKLRRQIFRLQQFLNKRLRMRPIPKIIFQEETAVEYAGKIEERLAQIGAKREKEEV